MSDNPLMNIGDLAEPATALIEKIADATGTLYEPKHIVEVAKAQAEAAKIQAVSEIEIAKSKSEVAIIQAESEIEITDRQRRAAHRWLAEQDQQQESIENTITKAIPQLNEDADPNAIEDDWIIKFFDKNRLVTDEDVQDLWASILAGEANRAGSYSPKALTTLADMNQKSLSLFSAFCSLCLVNLDDPNEFLNSPSYFKIKEARLPIIRGIIHDAGTLTSQRQDLDKFAQESISIYHRYGFGINEFHLLSEHGLIQEDNTTHRYTSFWCNNELYVILKPSFNPQLKTENHQHITISGFYLTSVGKELFHIAELNSPPGYLKTVNDFLQRYYDVKISIFPKRR